jgi:hypothetical protein
MNNDDEPIHEFQLKPKETDGEHLIQDQHSVLNYYDFQLKRFQSLSNKAEINQRLHSNTDLIFTIIIAVISAIIIPAIDVYAKGTSLKVAGNEVPMSIIFSWTITVISVVMTKCEFSNRSKVYSTVVTKCNKVMSKIHQFRDDALFDKGKSLQDNKVRLESYIRETDQKIKQITPLPMCGKCWIGCGDFCCFAKEEVKDYGDYSKVVAQV